MKRVVELDAAVRVLLLSSSLKMSSSGHTFEYELCQPLSHLHVTVGRARDGHTVGGCHMEGAPLDLTALFKLLFFRPRLS